ncbi:MAG: RNA polymerase sigma factor [Candidatus Latescibacterota bacterium]
MPPSAPCPSDEEVCSSLAAGDLAAFDQLYARYSRRLLCFAAHMLGPEAAQDVLQEVFVRVIQSAASFDRSRRFSTWVFAIAHHLCCNEQRQRRQRRQVAAVPFPEPAVAPPAGEDRLDRESFRRRLLAELERLDPARRATSLLRFEEGFAIDEIARIMGCPAGTVKSRLFYTARLLAERLQEFRPDAVEPDATRPLLEERRHG